MGLEVFTLFSRLVSFNKGGGSSSGLNPPLPGFGFAWKIDWPSPLRLAQCPAEFLDVMGSNEGLLAWPLDCLMGERVKLVCR